MSRSPCWTSPAPHPSALPAHADIAIVGAGIVGLVTAVLLAEAGRRVVVLDRSAIGAGTTGRSTAKVTALHGTRYQEIVADHGPEVARRYATANQAAVAWLRDRCAGRPVGWSEQTATTYADGPAQLARVVAEEVAARESGLAVELVSESPLPGVAAAVQLAGQGQVDPVALLAELAADASAAGATITSGVHVHAVRRSGRGVRLRFDGGSLGADHVVLATQLPFLDRTLQFARTTASTSYVLAARHPDPPAGMHLSAGDPATSVRSASTPDGTPLVIVGGGGHPTGRIGPETADVYRRLEGVSRELGAGAVVARWSAEDFVSHDHLPTVGTTLGGAAHYATGFGKWGLTNGVAAAQVIAAAVTEQPAPAVAADWAPRTGLGQLEGSARANAAVAAHLVGGWVGAARPRSAPAEGQGVVGLGRRGPVASSRVDGVVHTVSGVCRHLGGIVAWNPADGCWDCPLHGSRFEPDGTLLHGPATTGLPEV